MNFSSLCIDFYELTMANSFFKQNRHRDIACFDYFFRRVPDRGGYAIFCGLEQLLESLANFKFSAAEIDFLRQKNVFDDGFLDFLKDFRFQGNVYAFAEGSVVFAGEPLLSVEATIVECLLIETLLLTTLNYQSLIATKAARIVNAAAGKSVLEFGARRAHGESAAHFGARAAYIGGAIGTSNTYADFKFSVPALGTMAHAFVQSHDSEYEAFLAYAKTYPNDTILLVDTYDTLKQGIPNAIRVHKEFLEPAGYFLRGIRLDSGDLAYLSKQARQMLDAAGMQQTKISVSNSLDEYLICALINQNAAIDAFGVGERLITASSEPVFGGVYKIVAIEKNGTLIPKIKISENVIKTTTPAFKQVYRLYDNDNLAIADLLTLRDEKIDQSVPYLLFDPEHTWKQKYIENFKLKAMLQPVMQRGKLIAPYPNINEIREHVKNELKTMWSEVLRLDNPHRYYVDFSYSLWQLKKKLIEGKQYVK